MKYTYSFLKRLFDIVASLGGIIVTLPIWFVVIIGIEISDPGPLFYFARRVGKNNKYFYEIMTQGNLKTAINKAQKHFTKEYGHKATHLERNVTGYPLCKM